MAKYGLQFDLSEPKVFKKIFSQMEPGDVFEMDNESGVWIKTREESAVGLATGVVHYPFLNTIVHPYECVLAGKKATEGAG